MALSSLINHLIGSTLTRELADRCSRKERLLINGAGRSTRAIITTSLARTKKKPLLVIVPTLDEASRWYSLLDSMGWTKTYIYPTSESSPYDKFDTPTEIIWGQLQVLSELTSENPDNRIAIVATERSLQPHLPPPNELKLKCFELQKSQEYDLDDLSMRIAKLGYERVSSVLQEGTWSRRGDIVDIFPVSSEMPVRLEFFGNHIDKIREFDPSTQRSLDIIENVYLTPTSISNLIAEKLKKSSPEELDNLIDKETLEEIFNNKVPDGLKSYLGLAWKEVASLIDYLPENIFIAVDEKNQSLAHGANWSHHVDQTYSNLIESFTNNENSSINIPRTDKRIDQLFRSIEHIDGLELSELIDDSRTTNTYTVSTRQVDKTPNQFGRLASKLKEYRINRHSIWLLSAQPSRAVALLEEHDCIAKFVPNNKDYASISSIIDQNTPIALKTTGICELEGIILPAWKIVLITDREFFGQESLNSSFYMRRRKKASSKTVDPNKMTPGDYVVHKNHGIGQFIKIEKLALSGEIRDYLVVKYLDGTLRVAADQLGSLGRYRSSNDSRPSISKLGGSAWVNAKERVKKSLKKIALDLVKLYAERSNVEGYSYPPDGPWQAEMEDSFPFQPTPDQLKSIREVKLDMERSQPMDRLVCGDVGFGKTEVAIRAIFKAITAGKQVALLAPTTVLTQQHWRTINDRFAPYPIKVALLNRFKTASEKKLIYEGLKKGTIDAVIGTHQILNQKIVFQQLGLLVIDEEQRFGVNQKEKIKSLKKNIDVLTLSATPIPRTLYMSLSGVREMSLINTPPPQRRSIKTHLSNYQDETIRTAISQELDRGGQIFYVLPRIDGIDNVARNIRAMIPNIKIIVAHGQMAEGDLESSMIAFNSGEADIMICTTIIESGLDIPRVNTIIIEDAHMFGLSQLYQLRGRVGRSGVQAHAWLFYPQNEVLTDNSRQRLRAIQEFAQLGSGYQLSMRDMEIRGVGNILGVQQSGQMESIGFDLYMEMLQESLAEIQGEEIPYVDDTQIDLPVNAFIPGDWIVDNSEKIAAYREATECNDVEALIDLAASWTDRYGVLPKPVESLIQLMKLKQQAKRCGFSRVQSKKPNLHLETPMEEPAFRMLRKGLPSHLQNRLVFQKGEGKNSTVIARGLGSIPAEKQIEQLTIWFNDMLKTLQGSDSKV